ASAAHLPQQLLSGDALGDLPATHAGATPAGVITRPPSIVNSRSMRCAGGASWPATTTVCPPACAATSNSSTTTRASTSNAAYGSSSKMSAGPRMRHRARARRCRMPCEKLATRTAATSSSPTRSSAAPASRGSMSYRLQVKRRFSTAVRSPYKRVSWLSRSVRARMALRSVRRSKPSTLPSPNVGEMAVAISRSSVVFPEPFQPRSQTVSPLATSRFTLLTAARPSNSLVTLDNRTAARPGAVIGAFWALDVRSRRPLDATSAHGGPWALSAKMVGGRDRTPADSAGQALRWLLEPGADRRDALGVEAEPVHPAHVARVLDLEAAVHDHRHAAFFRDPRGLEVDHAELAPEGTGVDRHRLPRDLRQRVRRAEHVHDV